jgi:uncharacterized protein (TIGR02266 family)
MSLESPDTPLSLRIRVGYPDSDAFVHEYWPNVSSGGMFVQSRTPQPIGTRLSFEIVSKEGASLLRGRGRVSWVKNFDPEQPDRPHGMGLRFIELDDASQQLIDRVVRYRDQMRGSFRSSVRSKTVELQALAEEIHTMPSPQQPIEVHTEDLSMPAPTNGDGQGSSGQGLAHTGGLIDQAEARLMEILAGTVVDEAKVDAARAWARRNAGPRGATGSAPTLGVGPRRDRALAGEGGWDIPPQVSREGRSKTSQLPSSDSSVPVLETAAALGALERLLDLAAVPLVVPLSTEVPERRVVTFPRPELAPLDGSLGPLDEQTAAHEVAGLEGVPEGQPESSTDPGGLAAGAGPVSASRSKPPMSRLRAPGSASRLRPAGLAEGLSERAYADALLTSTSSIPTDLDRNTGEADFDLSEPDDPKTPVPIASDTTMQADAQADSEQDEAESDSMADTEDEEPESGLDSREVSAELDALLAGSQTGEDQRPKTEETHVELELNDLEFVEEKLVGPDDGNSDAQQEPQTTQAQNAATDIEAGGQDLSRAPVGEGAEASADASEEDSTAVSSKRKKKSRSGLFQRLLGKDD